MVHRCIKHYCFQYQIRFLLFSFNIFKVFLKIKPNTTTTTPTTSAVIAVKLNKNLNKPFNEIPHLCFTSVLKINTFTLNHFNIVNVMIKYIPFIYYFKPKIKDFKNQIFLFIMIDICLIYTVNYYHI